MRTQRANDVRDWLSEIGKELQFHRIDVVRWYPFAAQAIDSAVGDEVVLWDEAWCEAGENGVPVSAHLRLITSAAIVEVGLVGLTAIGPEDIWSRRRPLTDLEGFTLHVNPGHGQVHVVLTLGERFEVRIPNDPYRQPPAERFGELLEVLRALTGYSAPLPS